MIYTTATNGWVIIVTGINEELNEEILLEEFVDFGEVKDIALPFDRRTGYLKVSLG